MDAAGSRSSPERFLGQNYEELHRDFVKHKARFLDDKFPPNESSIGEGLLSDSEMARVEWRRPTKMVADPHLVVDGESRFDLAQGELGNCWFLAAIGAITFRRDIMAEIVPEGQSFRRDYAGIFHFRFWRFGKWVDVVVDDKLPTIDGQLIFVHCKTRNEFWPALLEKAYAKVCGSYADLHGGFISEALCDFTGGVYLTLRLKANHPEHWALLHRAAQYKSSMGCGSHPGATSANTELANGIVEGHAYAVTGVTKVTSEGKPVKLVRLLNPWGHKEWNGDWSDRSPLWGSVNAEEHRKLLQMKDDGEFWMSMEDFCKNFSNVDICCQSPAFLDGSSESSWTTASYQGRWDEKTAGGSMEYKQSFWMNPQYRVKIPAIETDKTKAHEFNLLVSLMQKPNSRHRRHIQNHPFGFSVFAVPPELEDKKSFPATFFTSSVLVAQSKIQSNTREVVEYLRLKPGHYLIVPFTHKPKDTASFLLTLHSKIKPH
ncbi:calpain-1 catalytic subunit isoform X3 [Ictalurus punctatus]|nr:calpain-1 catalytic subunit isoform X3 [Ictalurus punctatus]